MNHPLRRFVQKHLEFRNFQTLGLVDKQRNIMEIGCGSGYGAVLLSTLQPKTYLGIDLMPEQIALAGKWHLPGFEFKTMASDWRHPSGAKTLSSTSAFSTNPAWRNVSASAQVIACGAGYLPSNGRKYLALR
jgi:protein-L-isoaspartate O-methyltransferase